jgi:hypothetical protein
MFPRRIGNGSGGKTIGTKREVTGNFARSIRWDQDKNGIRLASHILRRLSFQIRIKTLCSTQECFPVVMFAQRLKPVEGAVNRHDQVRIRSCRNARWRRGFGFGGWTKALKNTSRSRSESTTVSYLLIVACVASVKAVRQKSVKLRRSSAAAFSTSLLVSASTRKPRREPRARRSSPDDEGRGIRSLPYFGLPQLYVQWNNASSLRFAYDFAALTRSPSSFNARCAESAAPSCQATMWLQWSPAKMNGPSGSRNCWYGPS